MSMMTRDELIRLASPQSSPCVSLLLPTHRMGRETRQDPIRLQNLVREAHHQLAELDTPADRIEAILAPAMARLESDQFATFWQHQGEGLALLLGADGQSPHEVRASQRLPELAVVGHHFHLSPLVPLVDRSTRFFLLTLSEQRVRLFDGSISGLRQVDSDDIPQRLEDVVGYDDEEKSLQFHQANPPAFNPPGGRAAVNTKAPVYHGQGAGRETEDAERGQFLRAIDNAIRELLPDSDVTLLLAGVESLRVEFADISQHRHIAPQGIEGNVDHLDEPQLHEQAWPLVQPRDDALDEGVLQGVGRGKGSTDVDDVLKAAIEGRVASVIAASDRHRWGRVNPATLVIEHHDKQQAGDNDLVDLALSLAWRNGARVDVRPADRMPSIDGESPAIAAAFHS